MDQLIKLVNNNLIWILIGTLIVQFLTILMLITQRHGLKKLIKKQKRLFKGINNENLEEILENHLIKVQKINEIAEKVEDDTKQLKDSLSKCIQRVGIVRFSAFENTGSDLSFSMALLDKNGDGIVLSSLYGREESRIYGKEIQGGQSKHHLSNEEKNALEKALTPDH